MAQVNLLINNYNTYDVRTYIIIKIYLLGVKI